MANAAEALEHLKKLRDEAGQSVGQLAGQSPKTGVPLAKSVPPPVGQHQPRKTAKNGKRPTVPSLYTWDSGTPAEKSGTPSGTVGGTLPAFLDAGIRRLHQIRRPKVHARLPWEQIVADTHWLAERNYITQALALGWDPLHLFGIAPDPDSDARPGLAVWLSGSRRLVLLDEHSAISREGETRRCFNCRSTQGAIFLWELN